MCPILIPTYHTNEELGDASLHHIHVACTTFGSKDGASLLQLFRDILREIYEYMIIMDNAKAF